MTGEKRSHQGASEVVTNGLPSARLLHAHDEIISLLVCRHYVGVGKEDGHVW